MSTLEIETFVVLWLKGICALALLPFEFAGLSLRATLALALAAYSYPDTALAPISMNLVLSGCLSGLGFSLALALPAQAACMWGESFDSARGQGISSMLDPLWNSGESQTAALSKWWVWGATISSGALEQLFVNFRDSTGRLALSNSFALIGWESWLALSIAALVCAFCFVLPAVLLFSLIDLWAGFLSRLLPHVAISNEIFLIKAVAGTVLLIALAQLRLDSSLVSVSRIALESLSRG